MIFHVITLLCHLQAFYERALDDDNDWIRSSFVQSRKIKVIETKDQKKSQLKLITRRWAVHCGSGQPGIETSNHSLSHNLKSERVRKPANEWVVRLNEWVVQANKRSDERLAQYLHPDSWLLWTMVRCKGRRNRESEILSILLGCCGETFLVVVVANEAKASGIPAGNANTQRLFYTPPLRLASAMIASRLWARR